MKVEWGSHVWLEYEAFLESGRQVDQGLLGLRVGGGETLPGLGPKLVGLQEGEARFIRLSPAEAFGEWDLRALLISGKGVLSEAGNVPDGSTLEIAARDGARARCRLYRLRGDADRVLLDFNHPLAGEALALFVRVAAVGPPSWVSLLRGGRRRRAAGGPPSRGACGEGGAHDREGR
jgi:FKBP-type peptidyl-prolyl cis-trans isomerase 2